MQTSGLVIHVAEAARAAELAEVLGERGDIVLGPTEGPRWPAVLESPDARSSADSVRQLERHPAIVRVDVVFIGTDTESEESES